MDKTNDTTPDDLMHHFRGRSLKSIIIFTIIVHFVIIGGTSLPYAVRTFTGPDTEKMSDEERTELAIKEAKSSLQRIADQYGIRPKELSEQLNGKRRAAAATEETAPGTSAAEPETASSEASAEPEDEKSEIEKQLEVAVPGPDLPSVEEAVNLFE